MNLYKITLIKEKYEGHEWDAYWGFMIAAENAQEAREIANGDLPEFYDRYSGYEQDWDLESGVWHPKKPIGWKNNIWLKPKYTKIQKIGIASKGIKKGVILEDYRAG